MDEPAFESTGSDFAASLPILAGGGVTGWAARPTGDGGCLASPSMPHATATRACGRRGGIPGRWVEVVVGREGGRNGSTTVAALVSGGGGRNGKVGGGGPPARRESVERNCSA